jgi:hypothetical protein
MPNGERFRPNSPPIIQETIDQETIMVNLETGSYYSLNPVGTYIWSALESGAAVGDLAAGVAQRFAADPAAVEPDVRPFVDRLAEEKLIVPREDDVSAAPAQGSSAAGVAYQPPTLDRYTDMQELLLLDPVHEVDTAGWPARR